MLLSMKYFSQTPLNDPHWEIEFEDNFIFFDNTKWLKGEGCDGGGLNHMLNPNNVTVNNGNLVLTLKHETTICPQNQPHITWICGICTPGPHAYTTGWVETKSLHSVEYGYIEARIKVSDLIGTHSAFWTFNAFPTPYNEIDIFEMIPGSNLGYCNNYDNSCIHDKNLMSTNVHLTAPGAVNNGFFGVSKINDYTQWHTYAVEWSPSKLIWYVDEKVVRIILNPGIIHPQSIILSLKPLDEGNTLNNSALPVSMYVDYVRVYKKKKDCNNLINECAYNFVTHDNQVKNSITIGGNSCNNVVSTGTNTTLRASGYISFEGDFTIPLGTEFYADANDECSNWVNVNCSQTFNPCWYDFSNYDNQTKKVIELGGNSCTLNITSSSSLELKATDIIVLDKGVTIIPQTSNSIILEINNCTP